MEKRTMKSKIDTSGWKEFKLGELFEFSAIKQAKSQQLIPTVSKEDDNSIPYVVQSKYNNMVSRYVDKQWLIDHDEPPVKGNTLVLGVTLNACSYQATSFGASQVITARLNKINKNIGIFIATIISKYIEVFTYKEKPGIKKYEQTIIKLPATDEDLPDFDYMDAYMSRIFEEEEAFVDKLEEEDFSGHKIDTSGWKKFKLTDVFKMSNTKSIVQSKIIPDSGLTPYVTSSSENNGILTYIDCPTEWIDNGNCIMIGGKTLAFTFQKNDFCSNDSHNIVLYLINKKYQKKTIYLFLISALQASLYQLFCWSDSISMKKALDATFFLPATAEGLPDFDYMDAYMQRIFEEEEAVADKITEE